MSWIINLSIISVPPQSFEFNYTTEVPRGELELECQAKGVYPRPILTLSEQTTNRSNFHVFPKVNVTTEQNSGTLFFDTSLKHTPQSSSTTGTIFECKLEIPSTNYIRRKRIKIKFPESKGKCQTKYAKRAAIGKKAN